MHCPESKNGQKPAEVLSSAEYCPVPNLKTRRAFSTIFYLENLCKAGPLWLDDSKWNKYDDGTRRNTDEERSAVAKWSNC